MNRLFDFSNRTIATLFDRLIALYLVCDFNPPNFERPSNLLVRKNRSSRQVLLHAKVQNNVVGYSNRTN